MLSDDLFIMESRRPHWLSTTSIANAICAENGSCLVVSGMQGLQSISETYYGDLPGGNKCKIKPNDAMVIRLISTRSERR